MYLNPTNFMFKQSLNSAIYVDKTGLLACLNKVINSRQRFVCVSRPRRFGKTMAMDMAAAYYGYGLDSGSLFEGLAIQNDSSYAQYLNQYNVLYISMGEISSYSENMTERLKHLETMISRELTEGGLVQEPEAGTPLFVLLEKIYSTSGRQFVFLIDEWDCLLREKRSKEAQEIYLDWMRTLLKDRVYAALVYMTGILPIKKYGTHSTLNMFSEFSMLEPGILAPYFGFTEDEVKPLCEKYGMSFTETKAYYNGYQISYKIPDEERRYISLYSPKSIVECMLNQNFGNYWNQTETYEALSVYIKMNIEGVKDDVVRMLSGSSIPVMIDTFQNDLFNFSTKDQLYTLLIHLGYLTYDRDEETVRIPNREVGEVFKLSTLDAGMVEVGQSIERSKQLIKAVWECDEKAVAEAIDKAHQSVSILDYNNEKALSYTLSLAFYYAVNYYTVIRELPSGKGFADIACIPRKAFAAKPALIIELKFGRSEEAAIAQIKKQNYPAALSEYKGNLLLVGINYSRKSKKHSCKIEELVL
jgi:hypothetical protein